MELFSQFKARVFFGSQVANDTVFSDFCGSFLRIIIDFDYSNFLWSVIIIILFLGSPRL